MRRGHAADSCRTKAEFTGWCLRRISTLSFRWWWWLRRLLVTWEGGRWPTTRTTAPSTSTKTFAFCFNRYLCNKKHSSVGMNTHPHCTHIAWHQFNSIISIFFSLLIFLSELNLLPFLLIGMMPLSSSASRDDMSWILNV